MLNYMRDSLKHGHWPKLVLGAVAIGLVAYLGAYFSGATVKATEVQAPPAAMSGGGKKKKKRKGC